MTILIIISWIAICFMGYELGRLVEIKRNIKQDKEFLDKLEKINQQIKIDMAVRDVVGGQDDTR